MNNLRISALVMCVFVTTRAAQAEDQGFRYDESKRKCVNASNEEGRNPDWFGECGVQDGKDFSNADWTRINLRGALFTNCVVKFARIENADLTGFESENSNFERASFEGSSVGFAKFTDSNLRDTSFDSVSMDGSQFKGADLRNANLYRASLSGNSFVRTKLDRADLQDAYLTGAQFVVSSLNNSLVCGTDFTGAQDTRSTWRGAEYDNSTNLPFSEQDARDRGMVYGNCR